MESILDGDINEALITSMMDGTVTEGLRDLGYTYVNLDDCWQSERAQNGDIMPDSHRFPNGITPLTDLGTVRKIWDLDKFL